MLSAVRLREDYSGEELGGFPRALYAHLGGLPETTPVEICFGEEARIGQKNGGMRPRQLADQRYDNAYLFGAICPARGVGAALGAARCRHRHDAAS